MADDEEPFAEDQFSDEEQLMSGEELPVSEGEEETYSVDYATRAPPPPPPPRVSQRPASPLSVIGEEEAETTRIEGTNIVVHKNINGAKLDATGELHLQPLVDSFEFCDPNSTRGRQLMKGEQEEYEKVAMFTYKEHPVMEMVGKKMYDWEPSPPRDTLLQQQRKQKEEAERARPVEERERDARRPPPSKSRVGVPLGQVAAGVDWESEKETDKGERLTLSSAMHAPAPVAQQKMCTPQKPSKPKMTFGESPADTTNAAPPRAHFISTPKGNSDEKERSLLHRKMTNDLKDISALNGTVAPRGGAAGEDSSLVAAVYTAFATKTVDPDRNDLLNRLASITRDKTTRKDTRNMRKFSADLSTHEELPTPADTPVPSSADTSTVSSYARGQLSLGGGGGGGGADESVSSGGGRRMMGSQSSLASCTLDERSRSSLLSRGPSPEEDAMVGKENARRSSARRLPLSDRGEMRDRAPFSNNSVGNRNQLEIGASASRVSLGSGGGRCESKTSERPNTASSVSSSSNSTLRATSSASHVSEAAKKVLWSKQTRLVYGYVALQESLSMRWEAKNVFGEVLAVRVRLRKESDFQITSDTVLRVAPGETFAVVVRFTPTQVARFENYIYIEVCSAVNASYKIRLTGSGGSADVRPVDCVGVPMQRTSRGYVIVTPSLSHISLPLRNRGHRHAFVRIVVHDQAGMELPSVVATPDRLVIPATETREVRVSVRGGGRVAPGGGYDVVVYWGVEKQLHRFLALSAKNPKTYPPVIRGVDFRGYYEDCKGAQQEDDSLDGTIFATQLNCTRITVSSTHRPVSVSRPLPQSDPDATLQPIGDDDVTLLGRSIVADCTIRHK